MATTTPNFGWPVPTSSDLVKNGATAIEALGDGIDASLLDLKGGTTGQVLKKNTNTDMDFVWSADSAGMTNPMTTTGDTIYSSSGSTPARLGIGSSGQVLTVAGGVPSWATAGGGGGMTLLSTTSLSGVGTTITGIDQTYKNLLIILFGLNSSSTTSSACVAPNASSTISDSVYSTAYGTTLTTESIVAGNIQFAGGQNILAGNTANGTSILINSYSSTSVILKPFTFTSRFIGNLANPVIATNGGGAINSSVGITSIKIFIGGASVTGTALIYGVS